MNKSLFSKTPTITVLDNRRLTIRDIQYYRHPDLPDHTETRITRHQYDARGFLIQSIDPRLYDIQQVDSDIKPNFTYQNTLSGKVLQTKSVDSGNTITLNDVTNRSFLNINDFNDDDSTNILSRTWQYEDASLPGHLLSVTEQAADGTSRITERLVWGGNSEAEKEQNLANQCTRHYDTAGLDKTNSIAISSMLLSITRCLLKNANDIATTVDWQGEDISDWDNLLDEKQYTTQTTADATGKILTSTDAADNIQRMAYDVTGMLKSSWLTLKENTEQVIVKSIAYAANGQKAIEEHGNGVVTTYNYEPETQRLIAIKTERPAGHPAGVKILQDLRYTYDPVGNVVNISNNAEETRFWRNQKVVPNSIYSYDSLYQLVYATGREMANITQQSMTRFPLADDAVYSNYTRTYSYDNGGNLFQIRHTDPATNNNYTINITVSDRSNRALLSTLTENPADVDALFTPSGYQKQLQLNQNLLWTSRGELQ